MVIREFLTNSESDFYLYVSMVFLYHNSDKPCIFISIQDTIGEELDTRWKQKEVSI